jgi:hypothetical protein
MQPSLSSPMQPSGTSAVGSSPRITNAHPPLAANWSAHASQALTVVLLLLVPLVSSSAGAARVGAAGDTWYRSTASPRSSACAPSPVTLLPLRSTSANIKRSERARPAYSEVGATQRTELSLKTVPITSETPNHFCTHESYAAR